MMNHSSEHVESLTSTVITRYGTLTYFRNDDPIGKALETYGEWAEIEIHLLLRFLQPGDVALDIGANIGTHTLAFAQKIGSSGKVYAFEPQGPVFDILSYNAQSNGLTNVDARRLGVGAQQGTLLLPPTDYGEHGNFGAVHLLSNNSLLGEPVCIIPIDELNLGNVALMKIDAEGMSHSVLDGARETIERCQPVIFSECNSVEEGYTVLQRMAQFGYKVLFVRTPAYNPNNINGQSKNFFGFAEEASLLFLPQSYKQEGVDEISNLTTVTPIETVDDLAVALLATPQYGDATPFDRNPTRLREELTLQHEQLRRLSEERDRLNEELSGLNMELCRQIEELSHQRRETARIRFQVADANARAEAALSRLRQLEPELAAMTQLKLKVVELKAKLKARDTLLHNLYNSTSWKISRPIRAVRKAISTTRRGTSGLLQLLPNRREAVPEQKAKTEKKKLNAGPRRVGSKQTQNKLISTPQSRKVEIPAPPTRITWEALAQDVRKQPTRTPKIDIVVPVYGQARETLNCLFHVLTSTPRVAYELVVIDDCGPDPELSKELESLSALGLFTLLKNERNLGFVATVNRGMDLHPDRDVLLLNSDTAVYNDWLDRILAFAHADHTIGTITPLSNNATICSYPKFVSDNNDQLEIDDATLDQIAARVNSGKSVEIPTGVGFCMFINRSCINDIGLFDVENFGRGYGEENDFCQRAIKKGWRNILIGDVFVRHYGGASFGTSKQALVEHATQRLEALHPEYFSNVHQFIDSDPVLEIRRRLDLERLRLQAEANSPGVLFITLGRGGGTERHVQEMKAALEAEGTPVFILRSSPRKHGVLTFDPSGLADTPNLPSLNVPHDTDALVQAIEALGIKHIHVQHLADAGEGAEQMVREAAEAMGLQYDVTVHDYMFVCPHFTLIGQSGLYCGEPDEAGCNACLASYPSSQTTGSIQDWRGQFQIFLTGARFVFVPSADVASRMKRYFPDATFTVRPHMTKMPSDGIDQQRPLRDRRVAIIGAIGPHKGAKLIQQCAEHALAHQIPVRFIIIGYTSQDSELRALPNVTITGPYVEHKLPELLAEYMPDIAWFSSVLPETFSYTLSSAIEADLFPVTFDIGAPAERLRKIGWGGIMPLEYMLSVSDIVQYLANVPVTSAPADVKEKIQVSYGSMLPDYYELDLEANAGSPSEQSSA
jgi:FkbM family methyltransferase